MSSITDIQPGSLLISEPFSTDPYFRRSVVLIVEHNETGDVGFILNKCLTLRLCDLVEGIPENQYTLCLGGPVQPSMLHYIHPFHGLPGAMKITDKLYWGGEFGILKELLMSGDIEPPHVKFFLGYSGWSIGQLYDEMRAGDWEAANMPDIDPVINNGELWYDLVRRSSKIKEWELVPENPEDN
ncbi:MAG: YqgE/AlgH family protein [Rikenellaceae bacterium]|nr:YqgE/AlgH family protein [Rikenellaceae bacterium]